MKLSAEQLKHYRDKGWLVVNGVYGVAEADAVAAEAMRVSAAKLEAGGSEKKYIADVSADGQMAPRKIDTPFLASPLFRDFILDRRLTALIEQLIGGKPLLATDQVFMKPPRFGSAKPYHQDNAYFKCTPADQVITAWIALDDVDEANGCLRYIDGSHRGPILPHVPTPGEDYNLAPPAELIDLKRESLAIVKKGGVVFHHSQALHTSHRNTSDRWRRGYATHWITEAVTSESDLLERAYFQTHAELAQR